MEAQRDGESRRGGERQAGRTATTEGMSECQVAIRGRSGRKRKQRQSGAEVSSRRRTHAVALAAWTNVAYQQMHAQMTIDLTEEDEHCADLT